MISAGSSIAGPCAGRSRAGAIDRMRLNEARYCDRLPPWLARITTVVPVDTRSPVNSVREPACQSAT